MKHKDSLSLNGLMSKSPTTPGDNENPVVDVENSPVAAVSGTKATGRQLTSNLKGK